MKKLVSNYDFIQRKKGLFICLYLIGRDATESFEDIGHSDEARELLQKYYIGDLDTVSAGVSHTHNNTYKIVIDIYITGN